MIVGLNVGAAEMSFQSSEANCVASLACSVMCYCTDKQHRAEEGQVT